ncbi:hypothetical protein ACFQPA_19600 [Halomarina halobia]|uniref:Uncharacterized protein n=1 Tax=Halomarina halobia TaxID=3033386 RepID=A0ABD6AFY2_9EURY|nr:hypothetical protein [Halomarina sp. PSR21]
MRADKQSASEEQQPDFETVREQTFHDARNLLVSRPATDFESVEAARSAFLEHVRGMYTVHTAGLEIDGEPWDVQQHLEERATAFFEYRLAERYE